MIDKEIDHEYTSEIVCPYCGYEMSDSWEYNNTESGVTECGKCDKKFLYSVNHSVDYSTKKAACLNGEQPHDWKVIQEAPTYKYKRCRTCYQSVNEQSKTDNGGCGEV